MAASRSRQELGYKAVSHVALLVLSFLFLVPLVWMVTTSLKPIEETLKIPPTLIPEHTQWNNYWDAMDYNGKTLGYIPFLVYARNTLVICLLAVAGTVFSNALVAYSFARLRWPGRDVAFALTLATMMVPFPVLMVPLYGVFKYLGWIGTLKPLWVRPPHVLVTVSLTYRASTPKWTTMS